MVLVKFRHCEGRGNIYSNIFLVIIYEAEPLTSVLLFVRDVRFFSRVPVLGMC